MCRGTLTCHNCQVGLHVHGAHATQYEWRLEYTCETSQFWREKRIRMRVEGWKALKNIPWKKLFRKVKSFENLAPPAQSTDHHLIVHNC